MDRLIPMVAVRTINELDHAWLVMVCVGGHVCYRRRKRRRWGRGQIEDAWPKKIRCEACAKERES